jgi:hypothetical protein
METARVPCNKCGVMILSTTAKSTGGLCMRCHPRITPNPNSAHELYRIVRDTALSQTNCWNEAVLAVCRVSQCTIRICGRISGSWEQACPGLWNNFETTNDPSVRHCQVCCQKVFLCDTDAATLSHACAGHCIVRRGFGRPVLLAYKELGPEPVIAPEEQAVLDAARAEYRRQKALERLNCSSRFCPECGYPCPDWEGYCYVCQRHLGVMNSSGHSQ